MKRLLPLGLILLLGAGCASEAPKEVAKTTEPAKPVNDWEDVIYSSGQPDEGLPKSTGYGARFPKDGDDVAVIKTSMGHIMVRFFPKFAPKHVANFLKLASSGFYNGTKFHRVIPGFMIQGGDPNTKKSDRAKWGLGGPGYTVAHEFSDVPHFRGILSMARAGDPDSAGSQFFIVQKDSHNLDGQYSVFGEVIEGMDVVDKIVASPRDSKDAPLKDVVIQEIKLRKWPTPMQHPHT